MNNLIYVPLERLEGRYTAHMDRDILAYLRSNKINYEYIPAPFTEAPAAHMFLNASGTIKNKASQLGHIAEMYEDGTVTNGTTFFFSDLWFPGIESLAYLNHFYGVKPKITGIIHAGSFTDTDEVRKMERWAAGFENIVFDIADVVYCGSEFIKSDLLSKRLVSAGKLVVTGLPLDSELQKYKRVGAKENIVVFNARNHPEKQPELWQALIDRFKGKTDWKFVWTNGMNRVQYYETLAKAKVVVSFALQENFGFGIAEAVELGCLPVLPNRLAYPEMYYGNFLYNTFEECCQTVSVLMCDEWDLQPVKKPFTNPFKIWFK